MKQSGNFKKRKCEENADHERNMFASFATAANSVTQLYHHSLQTASQARKEGEAQCLEKLYEWVTLHFGDVHSIPKHELLAFLQQQGQAAGFDNSAFSGQDMSFQQGSPVENQMSIDKFKPHRRAPEDATRLLSQLPFPGYGPSAEPNPFAMGGGGQ